VHESKVTPVAQAEGRCAGFELGYRALSPQALAPELSR
jgi:hypothetical protein